MLVAAARSLIQPIAPGLGALDPVRLAVGDTHDFDALLVRLVELAYTRVEMVTARGEFAVRGGIVDIFPPTAEHPVRVEFWGDEVSELRAFTVADQRSTHPVDELDAPGCRELLLTDPVRERAAALGRTHENNPPLRELLEHLAQGIPAEGMESLIPALVGAELQLLTDLLPAGAPVLVADPERVRTRSADLVRTGQEFLEASWFAAGMGGGAPIDVGASAYRDLVDVLEHATATGHPVVTLSPLLSGRDDALVAGAHEVTAYHGDIDRALVDLRAHVATGGAAVLVLGGHGTAQRAMEQLRDAEVPAVLADELPDEPEKGLVTVTCGRIVEGFTAGGLVVLTEADLTGNRAATTETRKLASRRRNAVDLVTLRPGDYVVHAQHGIGRFVEMRQRTVQRRHPRVPGAGVRVIQARPARRPALRAHRRARRGEPLRRRRGAHAQQARRRRLGQDEGSRAQGRPADRGPARAALRRPPGRARLRVRQGHAVAARAGGRVPLHRDARPAVGDRRGQGGHGAPGPDGPGGLRRRRLRQDRDRGAGRVQGRAGRQAGGGARAHHAARHPAPGDVRRSDARVPRGREGLSRFTDAAESRETIEGLAEGKVDVVIGTHRLLQTGVRWKDLGLVIVDEEQRFGVEHKEHITALRTHVDVLTLSATPIPRTLEMSLAGIREMSAITTPPEDRHPTLTYVGAYDEKLVTAAIRRELLRDGQVFYVHNRVSSIDRAARKVRELVPEARVAVAHGQMNEDLLERTVDGFWHNEFDVLVCTTIVENGLDISNANTLIVERVRHARALAAAPAARPGRAAAASAATPTSCSRPSTRSPRPRTTGWPRSRSTPSWARARPSR